MSETGLISKVFIIHSKIKIVIVTKGIISVDVCISCSKNRHEAMLLELESKLLSKLCVDVKDNKKTKMFFSSATVLPDC